MAEYGGVTRQGGGGGGGGSGSFDVVDAVRDAITDLFDTVAALPPEMLVVIVAAVMIGGLVVLRR